MSVLNDVAAFLAAQGLGVVASTVFIGKMPATPAACCAVYEYGGLAPDGGFGVAGVQYETPAVQVVFRGEPHDYAGPRTKAETAYRALTGIQPGALPGVAGSATYLQMTAQQAPFLMDRDEDERVLIACNYLAFKEPS